MLTTLSRIILKYPILVLTGITMITGLFFYTAFLSEQYLRMDFSLEQLFPESDPEKDVYEAFSREFHSEDDKILFVPLAWNFYKEIRERIKKVRDCKGDMFLKYFPRVILEK